MRLILVRHGQTDWNTQLRTQGRTDEPLNEAGRMQSALLSKRLAGEHIDAIYSSSLSRAFETASIVAKPHGLEVIGSSLMLERDFGDWEGITFEKLKELHPELMKLWRENPYECLPNGSEPLSDVLARCESFLDELREKHERTDNVLVVGHSVPLRLMIARIIGLPYARLHAIRLDNTSVSRLTLKPPVLCELNNMVHLEDTI